MKQLNFFPFHVICLLFPIYVFGADPIFRILTPTNGSSFGNGTGSVIIPITFEIETTSANQGGIYTVNATISTCQSGNTCSFVTCQITVPGSNNSFATCSTNLTITGSTNGIVSGTFTTTGPNPTNSVGFTYNALLPVSLTQFRTESSQNGINISWETASERNNEAFEVEHSVDGRLFTQIGKVPGLGNTTEAHAYSFVHPRPVPGNNYYRLKQVDFDGNFEYSPVRSVLFIVERQIQVYPTVAKNSIQVMLPEKPNENIQIALFSQMGSLLTRREFEAASELTLDLSDFPPGQFLLKVLADGQVSNFRLMKTE